MISLSIDPSKMTAFSDENRPNDGDRHDVVLMKGDQLLRLFLDVVWVDEFDDWVSGHVEDNHCCSGDWIAGIYHQSFGCTYYYAPAGSIQSS